jgi:hypothetical protein
LDAIKQGLIYYNQFIELNDRVVCFYAYKRINHFKEILAQFQGKETTQIPPEVIENIKLQIKKD